MQLTVMQLLAAFAIAIIGAAFGVILTLKGFRHALERVLIVGWRWKSCETHGCAARHMEVAYALPIVGIKTAVFHAHPDVTPAPAGQDGPLRGVVPVLERARAALHLLGHAADAQVMRNAVEMVGALGLALEALDALHAKGERCACPDCVADIAEKDRRRTWRERPPTQSHRFCGCGWCRGEAPKPLSMPRSDVLRGDGSATAHELGLDPSEERRP